MPRNDYHLHGESSGDLTDRGQDDHAHYELDGGSGTEYFEEREHNDRYPESSSEQHEAEDWEESISTQDDIGMVEYERMLQRQQLPIEPSTTRQHVVPDDIDAQDVLKTLQMLNDVHVPSKIRDGLYIANFETARFYLSGEGNRTKHYLKIGHVLSIINFRAVEAHKYNELEPADPEEFPDGTTLLLDLKDSTRVSMMELFPIIVKFIVDAINNGGTDEGQGRVVLVHCRKGVSRSVAAVIAYLTWAEKTAVIQAFEQVLSLRSVAWPNPEFYTQLGIWSMLDYRVANEDGEYVDYYNEYVLEKGLETALIGGQRLSAADLTAHMDLMPPKPWPLKYVLK